MAKKEIKETSVIKQNIIAGDFTDLVEANYMPYAMSVITSRSIPSVEDGLKPSQRKALFIMYQMGLLNGPRSKGANIAGQILKVNPHSADSAYETVVRLTRENETLLTPFVDGKGNFGKHYSRDMAFAASRYVEAKLLPVANEMLYGIKSNAVNMIDNYDATMKEPEYLPASFPNILANSSKGVAVGFATNIPSFNLGELCDATILHIKKPKADLLEVMPGPDFTTGAYILYEDAVMREVYKTGRGNIRQRAKYRYDAKQRIVEVYEIPFETTIEEIMDSVIDNVKKGKIKEINDIRDESDLKGLKIAIDLKRGVDADALMKKLFNLTPLQTTFACNFNVLVNGSPRTLGVYQMLDEWIEWRRTCVRREYEFKLAKEEHDLHLLRGLEKLLVDIDKAIKIIRNTAEEKDVIPNLMKAFKIDEEQANYIAEIKLRNLNKEYIANRTKNISELVNSIAEDKKIIGDRKEIDKVIIAQLANIKKKYAIPRKTEIIPFVDDTPQETIEDYEAKLFVTREGYIKKVVKNGTENKLKENDEVTQEYIIHNTDELLVFTDKQNCYKLFAHQLKDCKSSDQPEYLYNVTDMGDDEKPVFVCPINTKSHILFAFANGKVARIPFKSYETKSQRKKLVNAYNPGELIGIEIGDPEDRFCFASAKGRKVVFAAKQVPEKTSKVSQGVQVINLLKSDGTVSSFRKYNGKKENAKKLPSSGK